MEAKLLHSLTTKPPRPTTLSQSQPSATAPNRHPILSRSPRRWPLLKFSPIKSSSGNTNGADPESDGVPQPQITPPLETIEVRFRRRSKRRSSQQRDGYSNGDRQFVKAQKALASAAPTVKKKWEDMSAAEKAIELYVGEKGALYWLNKFAYASIFIVIGGWIVFRFVGPSLNLYQLDSSPLSPDSMFKGSS